LETLAKIGIIAGVVAALTAVAAYFRLLFRVYKEKKQKHTTHFNVLWKKSSDLTPEDVLGIRATDKLNFNPAYMERSEVDPPLRNSLAKGDCILIVGNPLAGKTRAVYEALKKMHNPSSVLIPRPEDIKPGEFEIPDKSKFFFDPVVIFDDINKFASKQNFEYLINLFVREGAIIIATCRKGDDYENFCKGHDSILQVFNRTIEIPKVETVVAEDFAEQNNIESSGNFDGNIGSLFVHIDAMKERYGKCSGDKKGVLAAIKRLFDAGIFEGHEEFDLERIKTVSEKCEEVGLNKRGWQDLLRQLTENGFIDRNNGTIRVEEIYLQKVIQAEFDLIDNFKELNNTITDDPVALYLLGNRADDIAQYDIRIADLEHIAIAAFSAALKIWNIEITPLDYAKTQNSLGIAFRRLAAVEDKAANAHKAITAYNEALTVRTPDKFPMDYGMTQNNLGNAYITLAEVEDKVANAHKAITAYNEALMVYTPDKFPMAYGMTQNNLGAAYGTLAEVEDKAANAHKAITAFNEALTVYTPDKFPMDYGMTQNNLGTAYTTLAEVEDKAANAKLAITAYNEALTVRTPDKFPMNYGMTQNNLGAAYGTLAEIEDKAANAHKAITAYNEALTIFTPDKFPMDYGMTQNNLGTAYSTLAEVEDKAANAHKAITAFNEALTVYTPDKFPMHYAMALNNLAYSYSSLSYVENREDNLTKALDAYSNALKVRTLSNFPIAYADTQGNIGLLYYNMLLEKKDKNVKEKALRALEEARDTYSKLGMSLKSNKFDGLIASVKDHRGSFE